MLNVTQPAGFYILEVRPSSCRVQNHTNGPIVRH